MLLCFGLGARATAGQNYCATTPQAVASAAPNLVSSPPSSPARAPAGLRGDHYANPRYGYALRIPPAGTVAANPDGPGRGIRIGLSAPPALPALPALPAHLDVDARYDVFYDIGAAAVQKRDLDAMRRETQYIVRLESSDIVLAGVKGRRYLAYVQCAGDPTLFMHEDVVVLRNREIYRLHLHSTPARRAADEKVLTAVLDSWRWLPVR